MHPDFAGDMVKISPVCSPKSVKIPSFTISALRV